MEILKPIPNARGYYISNRGKVYSYRGYGARLSTDKKLIKLSKINTGYMRAMVWYDDKVKRGKLVHRLVANAFIPNPNNYPIIMHKDNDILNNLAKNLKWGTLSSNQQQCEDEGRRDNNCSKGVKLSNGQVFKSQRLAADYLGISQIRISRLIRFKKPYKGLTIARQ